MQRGIHSTILSKTASCVDWQRQVMDGSSRTVSPAWLWSIRAQVSRDARLSWNPLQDSATREHRDTQLWMVNAKITKACGSQKQATWHRDLHRRLGNNGTVWLWKSRSPVWPWRQKIYTCSTVAIRPKCHSDYTWQHFHRLSEPPVKDEVLDGLS